MCHLVIDGVPQERRRIGNPQRGENVVPRDRTIRVNPNRGKQGRIPKKESTGIANPKGDPSGPSNGIISEVPAGKFQRVLAD